MFNKLRSSKEHTLNRKIRGKHIWFRVCWLERNIRGVSSKQILPSYQAYIKQYKSSFTTASATQLFRKTEMLKSGTLAHALTIVVFIRRSHSCVANALSMDCLL